MYINATMLPMMNFIVPDDWIAGRTNLNTSQCIAINVIMLDEPATFAEYVNATLMAIVDFIFSYRWTTVRCYPDT